MVGGSSETTALFFAFALLRYFLTGERIAINENHRLPCFHYAMAITCTDIRV